MGINSVNNNYSPVVWNSSNVTGRGEKIDFSNTPKPANADKFVLNLPANETIYQRKEFVTDESMGEDCAFCYTYMERTLAYGTLTVSSSISDGYFVINKDGQTFGKSGADMNNIEHAVEETLERKDRALEKTTLSGSLSGAVTVNGHTVGGALGFAVQNTTYKYSSESVTKGTIAYKNGGAGIYL
ncbi:MAG: hypothetical protein K2J73_09160 [Oscillospiraceae bacterium]|nr:hypothetical protein [Oscillospiraceae bacterium]